MALGIPSTRTDSALSIRDLLALGGRSCSSEFAVALGCELRQAHRLVYAEDIALDDPRAATPIGLGCRICERRDCAQRARPPAGGRPTIDPDRRTYVPYPVETRTP